MRKLAVARLLPRRSWASGARGAALANDIRVGAVYPLSGSQGPGGIDEHRGIMLAADLVNQDGGVDGRSIHVESVDTPGADAAAAAVDQLHDAGIDLVLGSYGSTISGPASAEAASNGMLFWETGAVGMLPTGADRGGLTFRVPPTGEVLGQGGDRVHRRSGGARAAPRPGDAPLRGLVRGRRRTAVPSPRAPSRSCAPAGSTTSGSFGYDFRTVDMAKLVRRIAAAEARRPVRVGLPGRRDRAAPPAGRPARQAAREHRHVVQLLHAGVRRHAGQGRGRRLRVGQAVGVHRSTPPACAPTPARCSNARTTRTTRRGTRT